jgi:hypothetical protein
MVIRINTAYKAYCLSLCRAPIPGQNNISQSKGNSKEKRFLGREKLLHEGIILGTNSNSQWCKGIEPYITCENM